MQDWPKYDEKRFPLHRAVQEKDLEKVKELLRKKETKTNEYADDGCKREHKGWNVISLASFFHFYLFILK